ncbi:MAG: hypothetical protein Q4F75_04415 [Pseudomonadota bacterium]|nr:hypothetical protein [Pseudomonadota bacterium]
MNINLKFLLLGTTLSLIPIITNAQCVATTDCASLGYTEKSCPDGKGIRCPFGNTFACPTTDESVCKKYGFKYTCTGTGYKSGTGQACNKKYVSCTCISTYQWKNGICEKLPGAALGSCNGYAKKCKIGDILNDDGTCTKDKDESKTPIGVVVYIGADNCGWAISKDSIGQFQWSTEHTDIVSISNRTSAESAIDDFDSCGNTQKIIQAGNKNQYPAAWAAYQYEPGGTSQEENGAYQQPEYGTVFIKIRMQLVMPFLK